MKISAIQRLIEAEQAERERHIALLADLDGKILALQNRFDRFDQTLEQEMTTAFELEGGLSLLAGYMIGSRLKKQELTSKIAMLRAGREPLLHAIRAKQTEIKRLEKLKERLELREKQRQERTELREIEEAAVIRYNFR